MDKTVVVLGNPKAQKRHSPGKFGNYDPSSKDKEEFLLQIKREAPSQPTREAVSLKITCYMKRPKKHFRTGKNKDKPSRYWCIPHLSTPDADNCAKFVMDAMNGVFWHDDSQVWNLYICKQYDDTPRTEVKIMFSEA